MFSKSTAAGVQYKRQENFTKDECSFLLEIIGKHSEIINNTTNDTNVNKRKKEEWKIVTSEFNAVTKTNRTASSLVNLYRKMKMNSKNEIQQKQKAMKKTGGDPEPPEISEEASAIKQLNPSLTLQLSNSDDDDSDKEVNNLNSMDVSQNQKCSSSENNVK